MPPKLKPVKFKRKKRKKPAAQQDLGFFQPNEDATGALTEAGPPILRDFFEQNPDSLNAIPGLVGPAFQVQPFLDEFGAGQATDAANFARGTGNSILDTLLAAGISPDFDLFGALAFLDDPNVEGDVGEQVLAQLRGDDEGAATLAAIAAASDETTGNSALANLLRQNTELRNTINNTAAARGVFRSGGRQNRQTEREEGFERGRSSIAQDLLSFFRDQGTSISDFVAGQAGAERDFTRGLLGDLVAANQDQDIGAGPPTTAKGPTETPAVPKPKPKKKRKKKRKKRRKKRINPKPDAGA